METEEQAGHDGLAAQGVVQPVLGYGLIALNTVKLYLLAETFACRMNKQVISSQSCAN